MKTTGQIIIYPRKQHHHDILTTAWIMLFILTFGINSINPQPTSRCNCNIQNNNIQYATYLSHPPPLRQINAYDSTYLHLYLYNILCSILFSSLRSLAFVLSLPPCWLLTSIINTASHHTSFHLLSTLSPPPHCNNNNITMVS